MLSGKFARISLGLNDSEALISLFQGDVGDSAIRRPVLFRGFTAFDNHAA